jgi:NADH:ubiquinone oxidoreductase subunit 2 (subunit N)
MFAEIGRSLLAISLFRQGFPLYFAMVIIQTISLGVWSIALVILRRGLPDLTIRSATGAARQWPLLSSGLVVGYFSLAGLPLLAGYPLYIALGTGLNPYPVWINGGLVLGSIGLILGGLRVLRVLIEDSGEESVLDLGDSFDKGVVIVLNIVLIVLGLLPQILYRIAQVISQRMMDF